MNCFLHCFPYRYAIGDRESIEEAGDPLDVLETFEELIGAFWYQNGFGEPSSPETIVNTTVKRNRDNGVTFYQYELKPHTFISAAVVDGQLYVLNASSSPRQWSMNALNDNDSDFSEKNDSLRSLLVSIQESFAIPT